MKHVFFFVRARIGKWFDDKLRPLIIIAWPQVSQHRTAHERRRAWEKSLFVARGRHWTKNTSFFPRKEMTETRARLLWRAKPKGKNERRRRRREKTMCRVHVYVRVCERAASGPPRSRELHKGFPPLFFSFLSSPLSRKRADRSALRNARSLVLYNNVSHMAHLVKLCGRPPSFPSSTAFVSSRGWRPEWDRSRGLGSFIRRDGPRRWRKVPKTASRSCVRRGGEVCGFRSTAPCRIAGNVYLRWLAGRSVGRTQGYGARCFGVE